MQHLGSSYRVGGNSVNQRADHLVSQTGKRSAFHSTAHQRVLQNAQVNAILTRLSAEFGHAAYLDAPIFSDNEGLSACQRGRYFSYDRLFIFDIETQGLPPRLK